MDATEIGNIRNKAFYRIKTIGHGRRTRYEVRRFFDFGNGVIQWLELEGSFEVYGEASRLCAMLNDHEKRF